MMYDTGLTIDRAGDRWREGMVIHWYVGERSRGRVLCVVAQGDEPGPSWIAGENRPDQVTCSDCLEWMHA